MPQVELPIFNEGEAPFHVPGAGKPCKTWYKFSGDLHGSQVPLVVLHGGPGCGYEYQEVLGQLTTLFRIPVVLYDQCGNGRSTHLPEKNGDGDFWTVELFVDELENLVRHLGIQDRYSLVGQSWGAQLAAEVAVRQPVGLQKMILASGHASAELWMKAAMSLRKTLPQDVQDVLDKYEALNDYSHPEYVEATELFYEKFVCRIKPMPESLQATIGWTVRDSTVYMTMNGPNEFSIIGTLRNWTIIDRLHLVKVPTLLINGRFDEAQDMVMQPYFDHISRVKWAHFAESAHVPHLEETERYMEVVGKFLLG